MISLAIGDTFLELYDNTSLSIQAKSPLFGGDIIPGERVERFRVPRLPNQKLLLFPHKIDRPASPLEGGWGVFKDARLYLGKGRQLWKRGVIKVRAATNEDITLSMHTGAGEMAALIQNQKLSDLNLGTETLAFNPSATYPEVNYAFATIKNPDFYGEANPDFGGYVNYFSGGAPPDGAFALNSATNVHTITPFPFLIYILERIFTQMGYYGITGDFVNDPEIRRLIIYNTQSLDRVTAVINNYQSKINIAQHMPDITVGRFLVNLQQMFNLTFYFDNIKKYVHIYYNKDVLQYPTTKDITTHTGKAYEKTPGFEDGFYFEMAQDGQDDLYKERNISIFEHRIGAGGTPFKTDIGTLFETDHQDALNPARKWATPEARQRGNAEPFGLSGNEFSFRLLFYHGLRSDSQGNAYPYASSVSDSYALRYDTAKGLYNKFWASWVENFLSKTFPLEAEVNFPVRDWTAFDFTNKLMYRYNNFFMSDYSLSISKQSISPAKCTLLRV